MRSKLLKFLTIIFSMCLALTFLTACEGIDFLSILTSCTGDGVGSFNHVHEYSNKYSSDKEYHWYKCECGEVYGKEAHIFINGDCKCGYSVNHVHDYNNIRFDADSHWFECVCGEKINSEPHLGGNATCKDLAVCEVCGGEYGLYLEHFYENKECIWCGDKIVEDDSKAYVREGDYIYFGKYPQTIKDSSVTVSKTVNENGYFVGSDGEEYAMVIAKPNFSNYKFSNNVGVANEGVYYFKVESIRWRILDEDKGLILCDSIIDSKRYDEDNNNYKESDVRAWLINEFYNTAFTELEQSIIKTTLVDNGLEGIGGGANDLVYEETQDKVFLLSYKEAFDLTGSYLDSPKREMITSDYARANGAWMSTEDKYYGKGYWWLRSPKVGNKYFVYEVIYTGYISYDYNVNKTSRGIVPALQIQL